MLAASGFDLVPSPEWRGGLRRAGLAVHAGGIWLASVIPDPQGPRLVALAHEPHPTGLSRSDISSELAPTLASLWRRARISERHASLALVTGVVTGQQDLPPVAEAKLVDALLDSGTVQAPAWERDEPALTVLPLSRTPTRARVMFAGIGHQLLNTWRKAFGDAGLRLTGVEPFAWSVLRGLAACGDVQAEGRWGLAVVSHDRYWVGLWEDETLTLWREGLVRPFSATDDADSLLTVARTLKAAWRFGGAGASARLYVVTDDAAGAAALAQTLTDDGLPTQVPLHARRGPLARGGAAALAALGSAAAGALRFPSPLWMGRGRQPQRRTRRRQWAVAAMLVATVGVGLLGNRLVTWHRDHLELEKSQLQATLTDLQAASLESEAARLAALAPGWPIERVLDEVRKTIPQDTWLTNLDIGKDGRLVLQGEALAPRSPLLFSWNLDHLPGWRRVRLSRLVNEGGVFAFTLNALVPEGEPKGGRQP